MWTVQTATFMQAMMVSNFCANDSFDWRSENRNSTSLLNAELQGKVMQNPLFISCHSMYGIDITLEQVPLGTVWL